MTHAFDTNTTVDEVVADLDLSGKQYLITGASSGLGLESTRALTSRRAKVIVAVRSRSKGEEAIAAVRATVPDAQMDLHLVDLASLSSVRNFCAEIRADYDGLDGILGNAGIMATDFGRTEDGFELQFGTNHLGHFLLVNELVPLLKARPGSRVVMVSSGAHRLADVDMNDPNFLVRPYDRWDAYGQAKSANALFALGFDRRHEADGVRAFAVAPGVILDTNLHHHLNPELFLPLRERQPTVSQLPRKTAARGAATLVWGLVHPDLAGKGGDFLEDCGFSEVNPDPRLPNGVIPWVTDAAHAEEVWKLSEKLVGATFGSPPPSSSGSAGQKTGPSSSSVASGLSVNRAASTTRLSGQTLTFRLESGEKAELQFDAAGQVSWKGLPGANLGERGACEIDVIEAAPDVLLITLMLPSATMETMNLVYDAGTGQGFFVSSALSDLDAPFERKTRVSQRFTCATSENGPDGGQPVAATRDLLGTRALYHYSEDTIYEHIYLNSKWYSYQCLKGMRRGDCGTDEASYFKVRDDVYIVTWREILIDLAAVFVYDMKSKQSTGMAWGAPGGLTELKHIPTGARFEKINDPGYPADIALV